MYDTCVWCVISTFFHARIVKEYIQVCYVHADTGSTVGML